MNGSNGSLFDRIGQERKNRSGLRPGDGLSIDDADAFPALMSVLSTLPKGAVKGAKLGRVAIFLHGGRLTACVTVPSMVAVAFYTADGFSDLLTRLEVALAEGKVEWREDSGNGRK